MILETLYHWCSINALIYYFSWLELSGVSGIATCKERSLTWARCQILVICKFMICVPSIVVFMWWSSVFSDEKNLIIFMIYLLCVLFILMSEIWVLTTWVGQYLQASFHRTSQPCKLIHHAKLNQCAAFWQFLYTYMSTDTIVYTLLETKWTIVWWILISERHVQHFIIQQSHGGYSNQLFGSSISAEIVSSHSLCLFFSPTIWMIYETILFVQFVSILFFIISIEK